MWLFSFTYVFLSISSFPAKLNLYLWIKSDPYFKVYNIKSNLELSLSIADYSIKVLSAKNFSNKWLNRLW